MSLIGIILIVLLVLYVLSPSVGVGAYGPPHGLAGFLIVVLLVLLLFRLI